MSVQLIFTGNPDGIMAEMLAFMRGAGPIVAAAAARANGGDTGSVSAAQAVEHTAATPEAPAAGEQATEPPKARRTRQPKADPAPQAAEPAAPAEPVAELKGEPTPEGAPAVPVEPEVTAEMVYRLAQDLIVEVGTDAVREIAQRFEIKSFKSMPEGIDLKAVHAALQALKA